MVQMKRALVACSIAILASCRFPPFDPELSLALLTTARLDRAGTAGPFSGDINGTERYAFVPDRDFLSSGAQLSGWVLRIAQTYVNARYSWGGTSMSSMWGDGLPGGAGGLMTRSLAPLSRLLVMRLHLPEASVLQLWDGGGSVQPQAVAGMPAPGYDFRSYVDSAFPDMDPGIVGACSVPGALSQQVELRFLSRDVSPGLYREGAVFWDGAAPSLAGTVEEPAAVTGLPAVLDGSSQYHYSPATGFAYLSLASAGGGYVVYRWNHATYAAEPLGMTRRVDAVLSSGRLFGRNTESGRIYSPSGEPLLKFPMGALDFVGEYWDGAEGRFRMVFALPLLFGGGENEQRTLSFEVYTLPTADVGRLD